MTVPYFETADRTRLFYKDWGHGRPALFAGSWALNAAMWENQLPCFLDHGLRCLAYDRRGHGRSDEPGGGYDIDTLADDLAALIDRLDLRDLTLVGHSMGCGEIVRYLTRHGTARVARIVLLAPTTPFLLKTADNPDGIDGCIFEATRAAWRQDRARWLFDNARPFVVERTSPELVNWYANEMLATPLEVWLACNRTVVETDFRAELPAIDVPALIIHGNRDASAPLDLTGRRTAALIPGSRLIVYEGAPHGLFLTHADRVNRDILDFIAA